MKKKEVKEKDSKLKVDYNELINRNLHDFRMTFDYTGYQYTRLDLNVRILGFRLSHSMCCLHCSRSSNTWKTSICPITQSPTSLIVSILLSSRTPAQSGLSEYGEKQRQGLQGLQHRVRMEDAESFES